MGFFVLIAGLIICGIICRIAMKGLSFGDSSAVGLF